MAEQVGGGDGAVRDRPEAAGSTEDGTGRPTHSLFSDPRVPTILLAGIFLLAMLCTLYFASAIFIPIALALLLNLLFSPIVKALSAFRVPAPLSSALIIVCLIGAVVGAVMTLSEPAMTWAERAPMSLRAIEYKIHALQETVEEVKKTTEKVEKMTTIEGDSEEKAVVLKGPDLADTLIYGTWHFAASAMMTVVLLYFLLATGDTLLRKVIKISPTFKDKRNVLSIARNTQKEISHYLLTITVINAALGAVTATILFVLGLPNPVLWGVVASLLNFIPYLGALAMGAILFLVSLATFHSWIDIAMPPALFFCVTALEGQFITPSLVGRRLALNPVFVFIALIICGWIWGTFGLFIAVPLLVAGKIVCDHVESLYPIAELLSQRIEDETAEVKGSD